MDLSPEDSLRLNVMLNQPLQAVRVDDSKMIVYGLSEKGEAKVQLNPNCRDEQYIKRVKEVISTHVLGSPGGYPIYLRRWTRMGQARDESLEKLLQLGEPEAVVAVVHAQGLTDELARRAWWITASSANARCMLQRDAVAKGKMGAELAAFLIEFLPFEEEARDIVESVRLVLQAGLIDDKEVQSLWSKGQRKNAYLVGFLKTRPDAIPDSRPAHPLYENCRETLQTLVDAGNEVARQLLRSLSPAGQAFFHTVQTVLKKPSNQDVVVALMDAIGMYYQSIRPQGECKTDFADIITATGNCLDSGTLNSHTGGQLNELLEKLPAMRAQLEAILNLSQVGVSLVNPIFALTDAVGTVMRRKIEPVSTPLFAQLKILIRDV